MLILPDVRGLYRFYVELGLAHAGVEHEVVTYPGAPHSFFDRSHAEHAEASADAWRRVLGFLDRVGSRTAA